MCNYKELISDHLSIETVSLKVKESTHTCTTFNPPQCSYQFIGRNQNQLLFFDTMVSDFGVTGKY